MNPKTVSMPDKSLIYSRRYPMRIVEKKEEICWYLEVLFDSIV